MWKKTIILLLLLATASALIACSQSPVDGGSNGIGSGEVDTPQGSDPEKDNAGQRIVDPEAIPLEIYGTRIDRYQNYSETSEVIGDPSDIKEIDILDMNGNYLMTFNSGKAAGEYSHLRFVDGYDGESPVDWFDSITSDDPVCFEPKHGGGVTLDVGQGKGSSVFFMNLTDATASIFDLECKCIILPQECAVGIVEELGTPTAIHAYWDYPRTVRAEDYKAYVGSYYAIWQCDGFLAIAVYSTGGSRVTDASEYHFDLERFVLICSENGHAVVPTSENAILAKFGWHYEQMQ